MIWLVPLCLCVDHRASGLRATVGTVRAAAFCTLIAMTWAACNLQRTCLEASLLCPHHLALQALPRDQEAVVVLQQQPVIYDLVLALIGRSELKPSAISTATADARDLPEELRLVRGHCGLQW